MLEGKTLLVRADADSVMGTGHVMRCLALSQAWQSRGGSVSFVKSTADLDARLRSEGFSVYGVSAPAGSLEDADETIRLAREFHASWIVVDGYHFSPEYQRRLRRFEVPLLVIDDVADAREYGADLLLNQNHYACLKMYSHRSNHTRVLLGARYVLLRSAFLKFRDWKRSTPKVASRVLVTLGGADPANVTLRVIETLSLKRWPPLEVVVVAGASNPHTELLQLACVQAGPRFQLKTQVTDMPALMAWADLAISAGGTTCWELAFMGLPNGIIILADNQRLVGEVLDRDNVSVNLGWHSAVTEERLVQMLGPLIEDADGRRAMSENGRALVDGEGCDRTLQVLMEAFERCA
ncbi:MAG: UDP-2,4-diacetamido-2,4,6-trideoxy-beta-L-altropyranose hydrolase [Deltaproteobacteria bacterium]|nr:UDP-2,4-diacetamido-2,4,6-trideoxy-beta-L-altropyranose hydrolase [Deltaproteobacteria bacterium]